MVRIAIINNYEEDYPKKRISFLERLFKHDKHFIDSDFHYDIIHYSVFSDDSINLIDFFKNYDGFLLSGSEDNLSEVQIRNKRKRQVDFFKNNKKPTLGICFGHQLLGYTFGAMVKRIQEPYAEEEWNKVIELEFFRDFPLLRDSNGMYIRKIAVEYVHHEQIVPTEEFWVHFKNFASTKVCEVQAIKHKNFPVYGVQFHPDTKKSECEASSSLILYNFLNEIINSKK
jgi:GMP synthase (glutamine-hydrolysing)